MTDEMKLIIQLCEALGFEVKREMINREDVEAQIRGRSWDSWLYVQPIEPVYQYTLTKKDTN